MAEVKEAQRPVAERSKPQASRSPRPTSSATSMSLQPSHFEFIRRFGEDLEHLFEDFGMRMPSMLTRGREHLRRELGMIPAQWSPHIDILQEEGRFMVRADLPGISKDDIKVEITPDALTIQGERKQERKEEREGYAYSECSYGTFYRVIPLPEGTESEKATADFRGGVLEIKIPTASRPEPMGRRLEIHEAK